MPNDRSAYVSLRTDPALPEKQRKYEIVIVVGQSEYTFSTYGNAQKASAEKVVARLSTLVELIYAEAARDIRGRRECPPD